MTPNPSSPSPSLLAFAVFLAIMLAIPYYLYQFTKWCCPLAGGAIDWFAGTCRCWFRQIRKGVITLTWKRPIQKLGAGITILCWATVVGAVGTVAVLVSPNLNAVWRVINFWAVLFLVWRLLQWWAQRRYRTRHLPARRRR